MPAHHHLHAEHAVPESGRSLGVGDIDHHVAEPTDTGHASTVTARPPCGREDVGMCRNITILRGLQPPATAEEIEAAARQYVRKVSGTTRPPAGADEAFERAVAEVAAATSTLLAELPLRRQPPATVPPSRRYRAHTAE